jgi:hypothetical protein
VLPKIKPLIRVFEALENFFRTRFAATIVKAIEEFVNLGSEAVGPDAELVGAEIELGRFLDKLAQDGLLGDIKRLRRVPEVKDAKSPDYHLFREKVPNTKLRDLATPADVRGDALIAKEKNLWNHIDAAKDKAGSGQADIVFIELGSRGVSGQISDAEVLAVQSDWIRSNKLKKLFFVRNNGGVRRIIREMGPFLPPGE